MGSKFGTTDFDSITEIDRGRKPLMAWARGCAGGFQFGEEKAATWPMA